MDQRLRPLLPPLLPLPFPSNVMPLLPIEQWKEGCLSVITALDSPFNQSTVVRQLKEAILSLANAVSVLLLHVPGHSGNWGN